MKKKYITAIIIVAIVFWAIKITRTLIIEQRLLNPTTSSISVQRFPASYDLYMDPTDAQSNMIDQSVVYHYKGMIDDWVAYESTETIIGNKWSRPLGTLTRTIKFNYRTLGGKLEEVNNVDGSLKTLPVLLATHVQGGYEIWFPYEGMSPLKGKFVPRK